MDFENDLSESVESRLNKIVAEIKTQTDLKSYFSSNQMPFEEWILFVDGLIIVGGEYAIAYESIIAMLEVKPFLISGPTIVNLVETALIMQYKTDRPCDAKFDFRTPQ